MHPLGHSVHLEKHGEISYFYDERSGKLREIQEFLTSNKVEKIAKAVVRRAYVVLGGDGLFVNIAKQAHADNIPILGINFGTKGFLLHDREIFDTEDMRFEIWKYPILHADVQIGDEHIHGHAFNEVYITRAGDASSINLSLTHRSKRLESYAGDGLMVSTPAGSTGWNRSYGGIVLPHDANMNVVTPIGKMAPKDFEPMLLSDKGRIRIQNNVMRQSPIDILADNRRILAMETRPFELVIERANRGVDLLIAEGYREIWEKKPYQELGLI